MLLSFKELLFVLVIAWPLFVAARPTALIFMSAADFQRRRRAWFLLTIAAFISPNFWILAALAAPILFFAGRKDSNPAAVYFFLMHAIPPIGETIKAAGVTLFDLDTFMLLSLCIMTPAAFRMSRTRRRPQYPGLLLIDVALLGYGVLSSFQYLRAESVTGVLYPITFTDSIRRVLIFIFIAYIPYFVTSRSNAERRRLIDSIASYVLACGLLSGVAIFESLRGWLLYGEMPARLGATNLGAEYLIRGQALRAMASSGHPLTLATALSIACIFWLYLRAKVPSSRARLAISALLVAGLFVTYSRGPWFGAAFGCLVFVALRPRAISTLFKTTAGILLVGAVLSVTPFGQKIVNLLPIFGGKVDIGTLTYRERLFDRAVTVIAQHPLIGDSTALLQMEDLRQGEGIIDLVNVYIQVLLNDGIIGLSLLLAFSLVAITRANAIRRRLGVSEADGALLGASLIASMAGLYVTFAGGSLGNSERIYYMLGALVAAYVATAGNRAAISTARSGSASQ
jgi:O-antigen ligase